MVKCPLALNLLLFFVLQSALPASGSAQEAGGGAAQSDRVALERERDAIQRACAADEFSGVVLVSRNSQPEWTQACGLEDREKQDPIKIDTPLRIASMGKMFTIVSILQLVEIGKLDLNAPISRYIPDYPNREAAKQITIAHLLSHTGGTGDVFGPEAFAHRAELRTLKDYVRYFGSRPLKFTPGSKWEYSNFGYILLGVIVENVSGESYYDYVRDHIFRVAGMTRTDFPIEYPKPSTLSNGYTRMVPSPQGMRTDGPLTKVTEQFYRGTSAGGAFSTAADLNRFAQALLDERLLSHTTMEHIFAGDLVVAGKSYCYGFLQQTDKAGRSYFGHNGGSPGASGELRIYPKERLVVVALSNFDPGVAMKVLDEVATSVH